MIKTFEIDTNNLMEPEEQIAFLILEEVLFTNNGWWDKTWPKDAISLHVNCNDVFAWGFADAEDILYSEIKALLEMYLKDNLWGAAAWCIKKRKMIPQPPVERIIRDIGIWNLEELLKEIV